MKPIENVSYWRDRQLDGLEICRVHDSRHVFPDHAHDGIYAVGLMEYGGSYCRGPRKADSLVAPGQVALINPGQVHSGVPVRGERISYRMVYFDGVWMTAAAADIFRYASRPPEFSRMVVSDARLWHRLQRLCRVVQRPGGRLEKESAIMDAVAGLSPYLRSTSPPKAPRRPGSKAIGRAMACLSEDLDEKLSLEAVARMAGLSRYHFLRTFKRETGLPPHLYRTLRRIDRAKQLLLSGRLPLAEVALTVGFADQSHFTTTFRRFTGATPGQYIRDAIG